MENIDLNTFTTTYKDALNKGVIAIFGEKYNPENVRVVDVPGFSAELCGGTHVHATGDIGCFKIIEISALSAGNRRILALTGPKAIELYQKTFNDIKELSQEFKVKFDEVVQTVQKQKEQLRETQNQISKLKKQAWQSQINKWLEKAEQINNIPFLFLGLENFDATDVKEITNELSSKKPGFYFVISNSNGSSIFIANLSNEFKDKLKLKDFGNWLKSEAGLSGGGKDNAIQGGGKTFSKDLEDKIKNWMKE